MEYKLKGDYFNGQFHFIAKTGTLGSDQVIKKFSPANLEHELWELHVFNQHVDPVIESAVDGFKQWRKTSNRERIDYLNKYKEIVLSKKEEIARAIALETGKPLWECMVEAGTVAAKVDHTINDSLPRIERQTMQEILPQTNGSVNYKPLGPCLVIGPFNFPCHLANGQIVSALIAGNSIIFKPSEKTAYSAQIMIECLHEAGFPKGVISLIQGGGHTASRLIKEKAIKGVFFTGSKEVGLKILETTHRDLSKLVALEMGGKNATIVHYDCNIDHTMGELLKSCFLTTGQRCTSASIIPIHRSIADEFINKFHELTKKLIIDHPIDHDREPFMGPLIDDKAVENYLLYMGMAKREGFEEVMRGKSIEKSFRGNYVSPSIHFTEKADPKSHFLRSELFAPNTIFVPYDEIEEAIDIANITNYGLAFSVFTQSEEIYDRCLVDIDAGIINRNRSTVGASSRLPFGGIKNSGNYRPAAVAMIDACAYQAASLDYYGETQGIETIKGIEE